VARLECSLQPVAGETAIRQEVDIRYVVTSLDKLASQSRINEDRLAYLMAKGNPSIQSGRNLL
jgi:hypothetical protein